MIVSKALRNIRQKIDWSSANSVNTAVGLWNNTSGGFEARDDRLDNDSSLAYDTTFLSITGGVLTDPDWHTILATYGDGMTVTQLRAWITANRTDLVSTIHTRTTACCRIELRAGGRYFSMDFTVGSSFTSTNFSTLIACVQNSSGSTPSDNSLTHNYYELSFNDFLNMGVPLVNNGDGTYKMNFTVERLRMKISEDV